MVETRKGPVTSQKPPIFHVPAAFGYTDPSGVSTNMGSVNRIGQDLRASFVEKPAKTAEGETKDRATHERGEKESPMVVINIMTASPWPQRPLKAIIVSAKDLCYEPLKLKRRVPEQFQKSSRSFATGYSRDSSADTLCYPSRLVILLFCVSSEISWAYPNATLE